MKAETKLKVENYTSAAVSVIREEHNKKGGLNFEDCRQLGERLGKSTRSLVAKVKNLGLTYTAKAPELKRKDAPTKKETVEQIAAVVALPVAKLEGLDKAPTAALNALLAALAGLSVAFDVDMPVDEVPKGWESVTADDPPADAVS